jgi:hypothetical protein
MRHFGNILPSWRKGGFAFGKSVDIEYSCALRPKLAITVLQYAKETLTLSCSVLLNVVADFCLNFWVRNVMEAVS